MCNYLDIGLFSRAIKNVIVLFNITAARLRYAEQLKRFSVTSIKEYEIALYFQTYSCILVNSPNYNKNMHILF